MDKMKMKKRLTEKISGSLMQEDASHGEIHVFSGGGCADLLVQLQNTKELQDVLRYCRKKMPSLCLGNGATCW